MIRCCKGCGKRFLACHGHCKKYKDEKAKEDALKAVERKEQDGIRMVMEMRSKAVERANKQKINRGKPWR